MSSPHASSQGMPRSAIGMIAVAASASIADAVAVLSDQHLKKVPVVRGEDGPMIGIVSRSAINRLAITSYLTSREEPAGPTDKQPGETADAPQEPALV